MTVSMLPQRALARPPTGAVAAVDSHAHVFKRGLSLADARRYAPDYDATPEDYVKVLDANGISHAVLVQPSFLGTDNSYLVDALRRYSRFRGIAVVEPTISADALRALDEAGVVGVRLNLIGAPDPQVNADPWPTHLKQLAALGWQVEVQAEARRWPALLGPLLDSGVNVVADHFGKPDPALGVDDPGFRYLLTAGRSRRLWVKLSGAYRNGDGNIGERIARAAIPLFRDNLGIDRLVLGKRLAAHTIRERGRLCGHSRQSRYLAARSAGKANRAGQCAGRPFQVRQSRAALSRAGFDAPIRVGPEGKSR